MTKLKASPEASPYDEPEADSPLPDAVAMLMADHKRVKKLFAEFASLTEDGSDDDKSAVVVTICQELIVHTALEEEIFYPAVRKAIEDDDLMDEALVEHAGAKELISQLQAAQPEDDLYDAKVTVLGEQIDHHVTEEEGSMFPQAMHADVDLAELAEQMLARRSALLAKAPLLVSLADSMSVSKRSGDEQEPESSAFKTPPKPKAKGKAKPIGASQAPKKKPAGKAKNR